MTDAESQRSPRAVPAPTSMTDARSQLRALVDVTHDDPLASLALAPGKSHVFSADGSAAVSYRTVAGFAVVSGNPIGAPSAYRDAVLHFVALCHSHRWRIIVLGASDGLLPIWGDQRLVGQRLRAVPIGRDVVIDVDSFDLSGRRKRNLRQAVQRTHNAGVTTEVCSEQDLSAKLRAELLDVMRATSKSTAERGFSMALGNTLSGGEPGIALIIARDRSGRVQGFQRYVIAGGGSDVSLELPWRRPGAPNGTDERLSVEMAAWAQSTGAQRISLAFAPFSDLFTLSPAGHRGIRALRKLTHLGDRFIRLESLYRYLRKFNAMGGRRYVLLSPIHVVPALIILLRLEFGPHNER